MYSLILGLGVPTIMADDSVPTICHTVAHLYANADGMLALRQAIDNALLLGAKTDGQTN